MPRSHGGKVQKGWPAVALEVRDVVVDNAARRLLDGVSFQVAAGETVVVAGEVGFGGTTLARVIAGLLRPTRGSILVTGQDVSEIEPGKRRHVGFVPAGGGLLPHLNAEDNIRYGMRLRGVSKFLQQQQFSRAVEVLGLRPLLRKRPHDMSSTQRTRVAIARLAVRMPRPSVWVVDATGEGQFRGIATLFKRFPGDDPAILVCTDDRHDSALIREADRLLVIRHGRVVTEGAIATLLAEPPDLLTARLVLPSPLPVYQGEATTEGVACGELRLPRPSWLDPNRRVRVALTSDALSMSDQESAVPVRVVDVRPEGARTRVLVVPESTTRQNWPVYCDSAERPLLRQSRRVAVDPARMLVFDAATERRLPASDHESGAPG